MTGLCRSGKTAYPDEATAGTALAQIREGAERKAPAEWGLQDYMCLSLDGEWVPGSVDGTPVSVAAYLEYVRRGGDDAAVGGRSRYREWLVGNAGSGFLAEVTVLADELERLTESGAGPQAVCALLDPLMPVLA